MSHRFNSSKNKPHTQILSCKKKVLREFQKLQLMIHDIRDEGAKWQDEQEEDQQPNEREEKVQLENIFSKTDNSNEQQLLDNMSPGTKEDPVSQEELKAVRQIAKRLQTIQGEEQVSPQRLSVITDHANQNQQSPTNQNNVNNQYSPYQQQKRSPSFMRHTIGGNHEFSSFSPTAVYPRSTGFIDFHKQTKRPAQRLNNAHEHRFQNVDHFPLMVTTTKKVQHLNFKKQIQRSGNLFKGVNMSDSCYDHRFMNLTKAGPKGILHFTSSKAERLTQKKGNLVSEKEKAKNDESDILSDPKLIAQLDAFDEERDKEIRAKRMAQNRMGQGGDNENNNDFEKKSQSVGIRGWNSNPIDILKGYPSSHPPNLDKTIGRFPKLDSLPKSVRPFERVTAEKMPSYFHNMNNRMGITLKLEKTLRSNRACIANFRDPRSTFLEKRSFRADQQNLSPVDWQAPKRKKLTFTELLVKHGYISDQNQAQARKRPWQVPKINMEDTSDSEDE